MMLGKKVAADLCGRTGGTVAGCLWPLVDS